MSKEITSPSDNRKMTNIFERYLTAWVGLCIIGGIILGKIAPGIAGTLDGMSINVERGAGCFTADSYLPVFHDVSNHGKD